MTARGFAPILIILLVLGSIVMGAGGLFVYQKYSQKDPVFLPTPGSQNKTVDKNSAIDNSTSKDSITDETANWKTYTDKKLNFSIKYPDEVKIRRTFPEGGLEFGVGKSADPNYLLGDQLSIYFRGEAGQDPKSVFESGECPKKGDLPCDEKTAPYKINNAMGITTLGPGYPDKYNYYFTNENKTAPVVRVTYSSSEEDPMTELFVQILSTFKFTE